MENNWKLIVTDSDLQHVSVLNNKLEVNGITSQVIDRSDSAFPSVGQVELYVKEDQYTLALAIINEDPLTAGQDS